VEKTAPIAVYTSGKGSSAAGLTASVIRDGSSVIPLFLIGKVSFLFIAEPQNFMSVLHKIVKIQDTPTSQVFFISSEGED
jgi:MCM P-loop domain